MRVAAAMALSALPGPAEALRAEGPTPVQRVVQLLTQMKTEIDDERKADEKLFADLQCWCKSNKKEKDVAINTGKLKVKKLEANIKKYAGSSGEYKAKMEIAQEAIKKSEKKLEEETATHEASIRGLRDDETELVSTVNALDNAVKILSKHNALVQKSPSLIQSVSSVIHFASQTSKIVHGTIQTPKTSFLQGGHGISLTLARALDDNFEPELNLEESSRTLQEFVQTHDKQPSHLSPHASQSGGIFGILQQMQESFSSDLSDTRNKIKDETNAFKVMASSIGSELKTEHSAFDDAKANFGKAQFYSTEGKEELQKARTTIAADTQVLSAVKAKCQTVDSDWELRTKAHADELEAVEKALEIMTNDNSRESLSFVQTSIRSSRRVGKVRKEAARVLNDAAKDLVNSWGSFTAQDISTLNQRGLQQQRHALVQAAQSAQIDAFTKVKELIDTMVSDIKQQMANDVSRKQECGTDIEANEVSAREATRVMSLSESNIEGLRSEIVEIEDNIKTSFETISSQKKAILTASEDREEENLNFVKEVSEQRDMLSVLNKAFTVLQNHYEKATLVQVKEHTISKKSVLIQQTPMPGEFTPYKNKSGSNAVLSMFEKIMGDCKTTESEALKEEAISQTEYEEFVADSNAAIESLTSEIATMTEEKASKSKSLSEENTSLKDANTQIVSLGQVNAALHGNCDFLIKFFTARQEAMQNEIAACQKAKSILSGAK